MTYARSVGTIHSQKLFGKATIPRYPAKGEKGKYMATAMTVSVVRVSAVLARLWMNGMRLVRMICTIKVCVKRDSTNQPV